VTEYEKKLMLTEAEYDVTNNLFGNLSSKTQTNYYFDTGDFSMNKKGITCRIREKDGIFKATVKNHSSKHYDCSIEEDLVKKTEFDPRIFNEKGLSCQGKLVTHRTIIYKDALCEMVLDRNTYLGYTDYELEVEYCENSEKKALWLLEDIAEKLVNIKLLGDVDNLLDRIGKGKSKSQRFFERKRDGRC